MRLHQFPDVAWAWCRVENGAKALRSLERIDPAQYETYLVEAIGPSHENLIRLVVATFILSGKDKEAEAAIRASASKVRGDKIREQLLISYKAIFDNLKSKSHEDLIALSESLQAFQLNDWSGQGLSVKSARESSKTEQDYWIELAKGSAIMSKDVYRDGEKFLATASGSDAGEAVAILSKGATDLFMGSRIIKEIAEVWRKEDADPAQ